MEEISKIEICFTKRDTKFGKSWVLRINKNNDSYFTVIYSTWTSLLLHSMPKYVGKNVCRLLRETDCDLRIKYPCKLSLMC